MQCGPLGVFFFTEFENVNQIRKWIIILLCYIMIVCLKYGPELMEKGAISISNTENQHKWGNKDTLGFFLIMIQRANIDIYWGTKFALTSSGRLCLKSLFYLLHLLLFPTRHWCLTLWTTSASLNVTCCFTTLFIPNSQALRFLLSHPNRQSILPTYCNWTSFIFKP